MRKLTDVEEIKKELGKHEFLMFQKNMFASSELEGTPTTLDEKDIDDILFDIKHGVSVEADEDGKIYVSYPRNVCRLESIGTRKE